jgi:hypothetical protein
MRVLEWLLGQAMEVGFTGTVSLEVHAIEGRVSAVKSHVGRSHRADD